MLAHTLPISKSRLVFLFGATDRLGQHLLLRTPPSPSSTSIATPISFLTWHVIAGRAETDRGDHRRRPVYPRTAMVTVARITRHRSRDSYSDGIALYLLHPSATAGHSKCKGESERDSRDAQRPRPAIVISREPAWHNKGSRKPDTTAK